MYVFIKKQEKLSLNYPHYLFLSGALTKGFRSCFLFNPPVQMYRKSYCTTPDAGGRIGIGVSKMFVLCLSFYVMGKALSGNYPVRREILFFFLFYFWVGWGGGGSILNYHF